MRAAYALGLSYVAPSIASYLIANALTYTSNRYFRFRLGHDRFWRAYITYIVAGLVVVGLVVAVLVVLMEALGMDPVVGQAASLAVTTPVAFVLFKRWTSRLR